MNKKLIAAFVAGVGIFAVAAASQAQNMPASPGNTNAPIDSKSGVTKRANGQVTSVDASSGKLMVKTATDDLNLDVQGATAKKSLSSIKVGDKVNVAYQDKGGMLVANSVSKAASGSSKNGIGASSSDDPGSSNKRR